MALIFTNKLKNTVKQTLESRDNAFKTNKFCKNIRMLKKYEFFGMIFD
jgi:hypothetical protein